MIRHLTDALEDTNPVYTDEAAALASVHGGIVAPATSLQVWTMAGLAPGGRRRGSGVGPDPMTMVDEAGYVGVVATNCDQTYHRYLRPGDVLSVSSTLESISPLKKTALGEGYFFTTLQTYTDQKGEVVGEMRFRILKFKPATTTAKKEEAAKPAAAPAPPVPLDVAFFWEGVDAGQLRIQRCSGCGTLRHPPRPMCPNCRSLEHDYVVSAGKGIVYSFVVHHHPPVPGKQMPFTVAVVELDEGTRIVGNVIDIDPADVTVGLPVEVAFVANEAGRVLPQWR
ncbi:MAG: bifunctional MaoC family dehydratase/OB-fold nucleic acid binding domain-containing protein, partial [Actinobacteria bacterium]|nr:bifunctional MaoC family dehydratase/OB-fold nucleic acid binding domain-containing protein [Actinomycetota bacterium]